MGGSGWLALAILCEVLATSFLKKADGFTRPLPSAVVILGYVLAFYCLSMALRSIPVGVAYAIWCGAGIVLVTAIAWIVYGQKLDAWALTAIGLILVGTLMLNMRASAGG
ncbi:MULTISPECIES: DMT family transporter [unclassified Sphingopyxis]|uniref:DMT family transporter n=1 Tax=unclassified Sphingopyxis TaxID=2614943 RepID=UPI00056B73E9|nr:MULTISPECIES: multidrug efflux SMR transporter [unclassified Sphingopyxis]